MINVLSQTNLKGLKLGDKKSKASNSGFKLLLYQKSFFTKFLSSNVDIQIKF